jgi:hypothetical protein
VLQTLKRFYSKPNSNAQATQIAKPTRINLDGIGIPQVNPHSSGFFKLNTPNLCMLSTDQTKNGSSKTE